MFTRAFLVARLENAASISGRSFSSSAELLRRRWTQSPGESEEEKDVYTRALKHQRPTTITYQKTLRNFVSFIGTIDFPITPCNSTPFGVYTFLYIKHQRRDGYGFRLLLNFRDEIAKMALQHLKPLDTVYVSGFLNSYMKANSPGMIQNIEVRVEEVNYVRLLQSPTSQKPVFSKPKVSYEEKMRKRLSQLHLWQVFFVSPNEWWDNRNNKLNPGMPDFKHKDTGEALWLSVYDPPWIREQLQILDLSKLRKQRDHEKNAWFLVSPFTSDEKP